MKPGDSVGPACRDENTSPTRYKETDKAVIRNHAIEQVKGINRNR